MKNHGKLVITALLFAGVLAAGCSSENGGSSLGVLGTGTTGTGIGPSGQVVLIRLGTDNLVQSDPPLYRKIWVAIVTDTAGRAVSGATVTFALRSGTASNPGGFLKGRYVLPAPAATPQVWTQSLAAVCANEDANFNAILDAGEDLNGNGLLDPPGVSDVNPTGITDASGFAQATISYPKNYASWAQVTLEASTGAAGATPATATFFLVGLAADYADLAVDPPGRISPFGQGGSCADTL
ncbi:MAG TPA: hypothetical protein VK583_15650 [Burkholderiales bacterium]|nr:hypothetical protein [Burkholderiales bacterium]